MVRVARRQPRTKIAARRLQLGLKQKTVAELTGISIRQLRELEKGEIKRPRLALLVNLAIVLEVDSPLEICEDEWLEWQVFDSGASEPPPRQHWLPERAPRRESGD